MWRDREVLSGWISFSFSYRKGWFKFSASPPQITYLYSIVVAFFTTRFATLISATKES